MCCKGIQFRNFRWNRQKAVHVAYRVTMHVIGEPYTVTCEMYTTNVYKGQAPSVKYQPEGNSDLGHSTRTTKRQCSAAFRR
jgi:hypothetical protein